MSAEQFLSESLSEMAAAREYLEYSLRSVQDVPDSLHSATAEQLESADAFTGRFVRLVDILCNRVLRALDLYEMQEPGTLLDMALRAEKRGLIASTDWLRQMKDVRNRIAHDYAGDKAAEIMAFCKTQSSSLLLACDKAAQYAHVLMRNA